MIKVTPSIRPFLFVALGWVCYLCEEVSQGRETLERSKTAPSLGDSQGLFLQGLVASFLLQMHPRTAVTMAFVFFGVKYLQFTTLHVLQSRSQDSRQM